MVGRLMILISRANDKGCLPLDFWLLKKPEAPAGVFPTSACLQGKFVSRMSRLSSFYEC